MKLDDALYLVSRLAFDTAPLIYFVERHPTYSSIMRAVIQRVNQGLPLAISSTLTLTEVLTMPIREGNFLIANKYRKALTYSLNFTLIPISVDIADRAAYLRASYRLGTPDAIQLATAIDRQCDAFLTNDRKLRRVTEITILILDELTV